MTKYKTTYNKGDRCSVVETGDIVTIEECLDNEYYIIIDVNTKNKKSYHQSQLKLMKPNTFEIGDVVKLKGGSVHMVVNSVNKDKVTTIWHCPKTHQILEHSFKVSILKKVETYINIPSASTSGLTNGTIKWMHTPHVTSEYAVITTAHSCQESNTYN